MLCLCRTRLLKVCASMCPAAKVEKPLGRDPITFIFTNGYQHHPIPETHKRDEAPREGCQTHPNTPDVCLHVYGLHVICDSIHT